MALFIDLFKYFIGAEFREGLVVVPILLIANLLLGIYVNLSVWYKLSDRTGLGAWVSLAGAGVTVALNILLIPQYGYIGAAWATLVCYGFMVLLSWGLGRIYYPVDYPLAKIGFYFALGLSLYFADRYAVAQYRWDVWLCGSFGMLIYLALAYRLDLQPVLRKRRN